MDWVSFTSGMAYGATTVFVAQPLDTIKTRCQALSTASTTAVAKDILAREGVRGLYRGGIPLLVGGSLFRSAQFGFYENAMKIMKRVNGENPSRILGVFCPNVIAAGFCGGIGRGLVEGPFEYIKVRRQVEEPWKLRDCYKGSGITMARNSVLFASFVIYIDLTKQIVPGGLSPFWSGAICSNLAWLTIWPLDVVKSQLQSGKYTNGVMGLLRDGWQTGQFTRGLAPGLARSFIGNGCSMVVYKKVEAFLKEQSGEDGNDFTEKNDDVSKRDNKQRLLSTDKQMIFRRNKVEVPSDLDDEVCVDCDPATQVPNPNREVCAEVYSRADDCMIKYQHSASKCQGVFKELKKCLDENKKNWR